ncbi:hypothetical protein MRX96_032363 [Rhipicephalus microplus]
MLPVPVMQRFVEPDVAEKRLDLCRGASGVACLLAWKTGSADGLEVSTLLVVLLRRLDVEAEIDEKTARPTADDEQPGQRQVTSSSANAIWWLTLRRTSLWEPAASLP